MSICGTVLWRRWDEHLLDLATETQEIYFLSPVLSVFYFCRMFGFSISCSVCVVSLLLYVQLYQPFACDRVSNTPRNLTELFFLLEILEIFWKFAKSLGNFLAESVCLLLL